VIIFLITLVDIITRLLILLLIVHVVLTYFMSPFHPIRQRIDSIIEPLLNPIRRVIPTMGMIDFSPLILILIIQVVGIVIKSLLHSFI
jgi:YggT family protein